MPVNMKKGIRQSKGTLLRQFAMNYYERDYEFLNV